MKKFDNYSTMTEKELKENAVFLDAIFRRRYTLLEKLLSEDFKESHLYMSLSYNIIYKPNHREFDDANIRYYYGLNAFGVKDVLAPIEEYALEIKQSVAWKKKTQKGE